ncbi:hypothetical protein Hanom_Chr11g00984701 [Helianthus anomalus]
MSLRVYSSKQDELKLDSSRILWVYVEMLRLTMNNFLCSRARNETNSSSTHLESYAYV